MPARPRRPVPPDFLWGTAISAHQSEGNNVNSDAWLCESVKPSLYREPSLDACDSYHRCAEDIAIAADLGFNCHRIGIEWARIEPERGRFSTAALDRLSPPPHYRHCLQGRHAAGDRRKRSNRRSAITSYCKGWLPNQASRRQQSPCRRARNTRESSHADFGN